MACRSRPWRARWGCYRERRGIATQREVATGPCSKQARIAVWHEVRGYCGSAVCCLSVCRVPRVHRCWGGAVPGARDAACRVCVLSFTRPHPHPWHNELLSALRRCSLFSHSDKMHMYIRTHPRKHVLISRESRAAHAHAAILGCYMLHATCSPRFPAVRAPFLCIRIGPRSKHVYAALQRGCVHDSRSSQQVSASANEPTLAGSTRGKPEERHYASSLRHSQVCSRSIG